MLTGLLLSHLRQTGHPAIAFKPFCSGGRADARLLRELQERDLSLDEVNPFHFKEPITPLIAARLHRRKIPLLWLVKHIRELSLRFARSPSVHPSTTPIVLIEGAGGLLSPLGEAALTVGSNKKRSGSVYSAIDIINALKCEVIVAAPNQLGVINHTLLTVRALKPSCLPWLTTVIMDIREPRRAAPDSPHNRDVLSELLGAVPVFSIPHLGSRPKSGPSIRRSATRLRETLRQILLP